MTYTPSMTLAQVLYDNRFRDAGADVTYDGTTITGFEPINAYDWRDFSLFDQSAASNLTVELATAGSVDCILLWAVSGTAATVTIQSSPDGVTWTTVATVSLLSDGRPSWTDVSPAATALWWRVSPSVGVVWRQITLGVKLQFPMGQWRDIAPPQLTHGVVVENKISVNGSIIGRNLRRLEKSGQISLDYLQPDWVRGSWEALLQSAIRYPFWWRWDPVAHPLEVAFAVAESIDPPTNSSPPPLMKASMDIKYLSQ